MILVSLLLKSQRAKLAFRFLHLWGGGGDRLRMSQREFPGWPLSDGVGWSPCAHGRGHDPDTNPLTGLLPAGHHREWLCPHHRRAAAKDCAVPTGGGQGPQVPRRPEANHSPLWTGMYPGPSIWAFCYVSADDIAHVTVFHFGSLWQNKTTPWSFAHLKSSLGANMFQKGEFSEILRRQHGSLVVNQLNC